MMRLHISFTWSLPHVHNRGINANNAAAFGVQETKRDDVWCVYFISTLWLGLNKRLRLCCTILHTGYFWCPGGGEG